MHDRTVDGEALVFGNQGGLFMNAMTWWDHKTGSVWSQPWGKALAGPLAGTELELLPSELVPWRTWREAHPDTLALKIGPGTPPWPATFSPNYVIGVTIGDAATAYPYELTEAAGIVNDHVGSHPVVVHVDPETHSVHVYARQMDDLVLTFVQEGKVRDEETGSTWQLGRGLAVDGPLQGRALHSVPYIPAFPKAWRDFYPDSRWYEESSK